MLLESVTLIKLSKRLHCVVIYCRCTVWNIFHKLQYIWDIVSYYLKLFLYLSTGVSPNNEIHVLQSPNELLKPLNDEVKLTFKHKIPNYNTILWYQRPKGDTALKLIGYVYYKSQSAEPSFTGHFNVSGNGENTAYLHILRAKHPERSAEYFGAAS